MYLAETLGRIDPQLVQFVDVSSATDTVKLLAAGEVDGGALTLDEVLRAHDQGLPLVAVLVFNISAGADVLLARPGIDDLASLNGMRVGVEIGAVGAVMLDRSLAAGGLSVDDVEVVPLRIDEQIPAWETGKVDAIISYEPNVSKLTALGAQRLFSSRKAPNLIVDVLVFRPEALIRTKAIQHLVDAHFHAQQHMLTNAVDAQYRLAPRLGVSSQQVSKVYAGLVLPNRDSNQRLLLGEDASLKKGVQQLMEILRSAELVDLEHVPGRLFDGQFVAASP
jgi:NitT/TauT family transport system substrate-binding protein